MTDRWKLVELIGQRALDIQDANLLHETAEAILDVVEPLIRADERERETKKNAPAVVHLLLAADEHRTRLADLRAKVEALPPWIGAGGEWLSRAAVLALFDRSSDE